MPLAGRRFVVAGSGPVAHECAAQLQLLGADIVRVTRLSGGVAATGAEGAIDATATLAGAQPPFPVVDVPAQFDAADAWARSGAMALTGEADGPSLPCPSDGVSLRVTAAGALIQLLAATTFGSALSLDPLALLGERAALTGFGRRGSVAVGGGCEMRRARDGWIALNLARSDDVALLPAWLEGAVDDASDAAGTARAVRGRASRDLVMRGAEIGLALAGWPVDPSREQSDDGEAPSPFVIDGVRSRVARLRPLAPEPHAQQRPTEAPLVLDLSSLWAGPLAGGLLAQAGARVVKVEGARRPDGGRRGATAFFDLLNAGKRCIVIDFEDEHDIAILQALMARASLVIEGSRPRVMDRVGIDPTKVVDRGTSWLSITAYGRDGDSRNRVGFGDDVAIAAGLAIAGDPPLFVADAVADPIAGLFAALAGLACLGASRAHLLDASLYRATRYAQGPPRSHVSALGTRVTDAAPPRARRERGTAEAFGASTDAILSELMPDAWRDRRAKMRPPRSAEGDL